MFVICALLELQLLMENVNALILVNILMNLQKAAYAHLKLTLSMENANNVNLVNIGMVKAVLIFAPNLPT